MLFKQGHKFLIPLFILSIVIFNCQTKFQIPEKTVNPPIGLTAYPTNNGIIIKFYGNNVEEGFTGYNIYVSTSPTLPTITLILLKTVITDIRLCRMVQQDVSLTPHRYLLSQSKRIQIRLP